MSKEWMPELSWEQVQFLWNTGNLNFFRLYDDDTEASVECDEWEDIQRHYDKGGRFGIEETEIFKVVTEIRNETKRVVYDSKDCAFPDSEELKQKCRKHNMWGELEVQSTALTVKEDYADSEEYGIYVSEDFEKVYVEDN